MRSDQNARDGSEVSAVLTVRDDELHRLGNACAEVVRCRADVFAFMRVVGGVDDDIVDGMGDALGQR